MGQHRLDETREEGIFDFVVASTSIATPESKVIWNLQDVAGGRKAVKPDLPYITMNISSGPNLIHTPEGNWKEQDIFTKSFRYFFTLTINVFANENWLGLAQEILEGLDLETKKSILRLAGIAQAGTPSDIVDISELLDTKHEGRASFDMFLGYTREVDDATGEIKKVDITGTIGTFETNNVIDNT